MSDDTRSMHPKARRPVRRGRVLVVNNPSPDSDSDQDIPIPQETYKPYVYPRPLPSPSLSLPAAESLYSERHHNPPTNPHILTTDIQYNSSRSNPSNGTLSSPSSSSSPAVETTPPPSTPGLTGPGIHLTDEGTVRQDTLKFIPVDRVDATPQPPPRSREVERVRSHLPGQGPTRRGSLSGSRPATVRPYNLCATLSPG